MYEGFTEKARRVMFFARYEASVLGSDSIEPEHLLLGLLREDKALAVKFIGKFSEVEAIRKQIVDAMSHAEALSTSIDLPLSKASESVLAKADKERMRQGVANVGTEHLLLGLLQQTSLAARVLRERSVKIESVRELFEKPVASGPTRKRKTTACKDCRHLIADGEPHQLRLNLFCAASPLEPEFDCYTGEFRHGEADRPGDRYQACIMVNFGDCSLFEPKPEIPEQRASA